MRIFTKIVILLSVVLVWLTLAGCETLSYCSLAPAARCELEATLENGLLDKLDVVVDVDVVCPDAGNCPPATDPAPGDEAGDFRHVSVIVSPP